MIYNFSAAPASQAGSSTINTTPEATEACKAETQSSEPMEAPQAVKRTVIQREIGPKKYRRVLLGVPKKVKAVTNVQMIEQAHLHFMIRVDENKRRDCWGCQIRDRLARLREKAPPGGRPSLQDITNKKKNEWAKRVKAKCLQCDVPLCVHGECWDIYHNSKKFS
jgi:hypothetical protein